MGNNQLNLGMDIVDLGVGNGNHRHQLPSESVGTMELEAIHMEYRHYAGWILACSFVDMRKDR